MMAAGRAAECGAPVLLLEKTPRLGNKLRLTGKGRCNLTNEADLDTFVSHFGDTGRFLYAAFSRFFVNDLLSFFERRGVITTVERGGRVFPQSNDARQIAAALEGYLLSTGVEVRYRSPVEELVLADGRATAVHCRGQRILAEAVILATGGASYPRTGSSGDGYRLAAAVGHRVVPIAPALVPLVTRERWVRDLQGLTLRNVQVKLYQGDALLADAFGDLLFTHFGVSGPTVLTLSKRAVAALADGVVRLSINLKPSASFEEFDHRLQATLASQGRRLWRTVVAGILPRKLVPAFLTLVGVAADKPANQITSEERQRTVALCQDLRLTVVEARPLAEAIITTGGVDVREVWPQTLESRLVGGLYFCGEVLDVDADTGGFNLQAAFSTGWLAGESAARAICDL